jgi:hypothetical protein
LIDRAWLNDQNNQKGWGQNNHGAWCLSTDGNDHHGWTGSGASGCYRTLRFDDNGSVYYYHDQNWTPGRRSLEECPTLEDVQECEADESRDQAECNALVDQIFNYDMNHPELGELLPADEGGLGIEIDSAMGMAMVTPSTDNLNSWAVYGLAGVGFAFLAVQGATWFKKQTQKETFTPLKAQDEL